MSQDSKLSDKYHVEWEKDNEYAIYEYGEDGIIFSGSLPEVNAWLDLKAKGFHP